MRRDARPVSRMKEISGSRFLLRGVGTQMMIASTSRTRLKSVEAQSRRSLTLSAIVSAGIWWI